MDAAVLDVERREVEPYETHRLRWNWEQYRAMAEMGWFHETRVELIEGIIYDKFPPEGEPRPVRWTKEQFYHLADLGWFDGRRVELVGGEVCEMNAMHSPHATALVLVEEALRGAFGRDYFLRIQTPLNLGEAEEPELDIAVVQGRPRDFSDRHPRTAALIVEVSDSTLVFDCTVKAALYAETGIADYWILNLRRRVLEVRQLPTPQPHRLGYGYDSLTVLGVGESIAPLAAPGSPVLVSDLLP